MRAAALESGSGAPVRHVTGGLVAKEKTSGRGPDLELMCSLVQNVIHGVVGPFLPPESQPSAVRRAFMTVYVAAPNGRCHGSGQNRTPLKLATKTTRLVVKGGGMMGSEACSSTRGAVLHGCDPCGTISARSLPVRLSIPY